MTPRRLSPEADRGMATIWTVVVAGACLLMVGLVLDGGTVLRARNTSADLAAGAARAGAQELDQPALAAGRAVIDPEAATQTALSWLTHRGTTGTVDVTDETVTVTVQTKVPLQLLRRASVTVTETGSARAHHGRPSP